MKYRLVSIYGGEAIDFEMFNQGSCLCFSFPKGNVLICGPDPLQYGDNNTSVTEERKAGGIRSCPGFGRDRVNFLPMLCFEFSMR